MQASISKIFMQWNGWDGQSSRILGVPQLDLLAEGIRQDTVLNAAHQLVGLLGQAKGQDLGIIGLVRAQILPNAQVMQTYSVGKDTGQMSEEALVDSQNTLGADSLEQAIEDTLVKVTSLIVHASHNGI